MREPCETPFQVAAEDGVVNIDGPCGVVVALTWEAAIESSDRLLEQAALAKGQQWALKVLPKAD